MCVGQLRSCDLLKLTSCFRCTYQQAEAENAAAAKQAKEVRADSQGRPLLHAGIEKRPFGRGWCEWLPRLLMANLPCPDFLFLFNCAGGGAAQAGSGPARGRSQAAGAR